MINTIFEEFLSKNIKIKSKQKLLSYIEYCINHNSLENKGSVHHILPVSLFPEFKNLSIFKWNSSNLSFYEHYYAHWLLTECLNESSMIFAFTAMHYKDYKNGRITKEELISEEDFKKKMEERSKIISESNKKRAKEGTLFNGWVWDREKANDKRKETLKKNPQIQEEANKKHSLTKNSKEWKETKGKEQSIKQSRTKKSKYFKDFIEPSRVKKFKKSFSETFNKEKHYETTLKRSKFKNFKIFNKQDEVIFEYEGLLTEFCKINNLPLAALKKSSKENRMYNTTAGLRNAKKYGYEKYEGCYLVLL